MLTSEDITKALFDFLQSSFGKDFQAVAETSLDPALVEKVKAVLSVSEHLLASDVKMMPLGEKRALYEIIGQHVSLSVLAQKTQIPDDFLSGCADDRLGLYILRLLSESPIPFPELMRR